MKKIALIIYTLTLCCGLSAQKTDAGKTSKGKISKYEMFVYTNNGLDTQSNRGFGEDLLNATLGAGKGIAGGYVTSFIDLGVNMLGTLITKNAADRKQWEEIVTAENQFQETISTEQSINDFYANTSTKSAMDPQGMKFDGIGCLRTVEGDTAFFISCRLNRDKIDRIINHSKFELTLDTLIIAPYRGNLPNSTFDNRFSFDDRQNLRIALDITLTSSWMNMQTQLQSDQQLGHFTITIPVAQVDLDKNGRLYYVRQGNAPGKYQIEGESFIVPRSYMGFRDETGEYSDSWGTGEYNISIQLKETCNATDTYRNHWKANWKKRKEASKKENFAQLTWKKISSQKWNELSKQWVVTIVKAPADVATKEFLEEIKLNGTTPTKPAASSSTAKSGSDGSAKPENNQGGDGQGKGGGKPK
ncbi:MAG: hypothetical protein LBN18_00380 [Dysgonamonadaceae bacterium]|jgi:hypothetical protein|nr:hypothetical protein [Dysgonamonadaceae bacterium]